MLRTMLTIAATLVTWIIQNAYQLEGIDRQWKY